MAKEQEAMKDPQDTQTLDLFGKLEKARGHWAEREKRKPQDNPTPTPQRTEVIRFFPGWIDEKRAGPDICLRSALFGVVRPGRRRWCKDELLAAVNGYTVRWSGERLDQGDLDIWLQLLHLLRDQPIGGRVEFSPRSVLRAMGRNTGKSAREWLIRGLNRLSGGAVTLESNRFMVRGGLLVWGIDKETDRCFASPHRDIVPLFQRDTYTLLDFEQRLSVHSQLGRWLHEFYSTHAKPHAYKVETLRELCGSETVHLFHFRAELRQALQELVAAGLLVSWEIDAGDLVRVKKRPSASQARHLIGKATKASRKPRKPQKSKD